jgi:hypothetical protein
MKARVNWGIFLCILLFVGVQATADDIIPDQGSGTVAKIRVSIPVGDYSINAVEGGDKLSLHDFGYLLIPGKPKLPSKIFTIALPPGARAISVNCEVGSETVLSGRYSVIPSPLPRSIGEEDPNIYARDKQMYDDNYASVYGDDAVYPDNITELVASAGYRSYNLVDIRVTPFEFHPLSGRLTLNSELTLIISYIIPANHSVTDAVSGETSKAQRTAESIIFNYDQASSWYPTVGLKRGLYDFVIITLESLTAAVQPLVDWETAKGRNVQVVTIAWINGSYNGYDLAERIRNFLRDKYPAEEWGIEDALIIGHVNDIPMRLTEQDWGYGKVKTDLYYAELSYPDSESWDANQNHYWGEDADNVDFYSEINVGRIPWSGAIDVENICLKTVAYEQNQDPEFKKNILLLGGYFWNDDPNPVTDNAILMEAKVDQPWMADWTMTRMYEKNNDCWSSYDCDYPLLNSNVMAVWSAGKFAFVNWAGHGSPTSSHIYGIGAPAFISSYNCSQLNDAYPAIIFADACSNSNPDYLNIGQAMIRQGAVGFLGATQVAGGMPGWADPYDGSSQSLDYFFTTYVTSGDYTLGEAHQKALRDMYVYGLWGGAVYYQMFQWGNIWGNPDLAMTMPAIEIQIPDPLPEYMVPDSTTTVTVRILENTDTCVPGSELLYYRYDEGGDYTTAPLIAIGGGLYEAELNPPECKALPEYYFSAEGVECGIICNPATAPAIVYSAMVGAPVTVFTDNFEEDAGWTVENDGSLTGGAWERGVPAGGGERGDPPTDRDGSGQCYLTGNAYGDSDVDGGATSLISPTLNLDGIDAEIRYSLWYTNGMGGDPNNDYFYIYLSGDDGASWNLVESIGPQGLSGWNDKSLLVSDFMTPTDQVKVRFEASDLGMGSVVEAGIDDINVLYVECTDYIYGDANMDGELNVADAVFVINYVFKGGPAPNPVGAGDANCDGDSNVADAVYMINFVFHGGPAPDC